MSTAKLEGHVFVIADDEMSMRKCEAMYRRIEASLKALDTFTVHISNLDENDPQLAGKCANTMNALCRSVVTIYPTPSQLDADIESLKQMTVRRSQNGENN